MIPATKKKIASAKQTSAGRKKKQASTAPFSASKKSRPAHRPLISDDKLRSLYSAMLLCRWMEERANRKGRRPNEVPPPAANLMTGLEAVIVGSTIDLKTEDTITAPSGEVILRHNNEPLKRSRISGNLAPRDVIAFATASGAQLTIGTGIALSNRHHKTDNVVVSFGDADAQSSGSWNEALHLAGLHHLPILFVLRPPRIGSMDHQATLANIVESANIAGVMMIPVDAKDVVAMYRVSFESIARARNGTGATLIVCTHYVVDGDERQGTSAAGVILDPIARMEEYLTGKGLFSKQWKQTLIRDFI